MPVTLDLMEYPDNAAAREAYVSSDDYAVAGVIDSYSEANQSGFDTVNHLWDTGSCGAGQAFTAPSTFKITSCKFYLKKAGSPTGIANAVLYAATGTIGTSGRPTGSVLATSDGFQISGLTTSLALITFTFSGLEQYELQEGNNYVIFFRAPSEGFLDASNVVYPGRDTTSPTHAGNYVRRYTPWWVYDNPYGDLCFYVYGQVVHLQCYSESLIKEQGSYSLGGFAKGTDSLNDTLTRTVDPTVNLADLTKIKFGIYALRTGTNIKARIRDSGGIWSEYSIAISIANTWETKEWDISAISNANKDAIDRIQFEIIEASADNILYLDNMFGGWPVLTLEESLAFLESWEISRFLELEESLAFLESLPSLDRGLVLEENLALKEEEKVDINAILTESLGLLESLPGLDRTLEPLTENLALLEALTEEDRGLSLDEALALLESLPTLERALTLDEALALKEAETADIQALMTESLGLKEELTQLGRALTLEESLALLEEAHAETLLFKVDESGDVIIPSLKDAGDAYAYIDSEGKLHRGAGYP